MQSQSERRRVLMIAHSFPPASNVGALRPLRVLQQFVADGWDPTVLSAATDTYNPSTPFDPALLERVPARAEVVRAPVVRVAPLASRLVAPFRGRAGTAPGARSVATTPEAPSDHRSVLRRAVDFVDEVTTIPDREAGWILPATLRGLALVARRRPHVLYSTAPPWTVQVVALALAKLTGVRWVADFRDPWARAPWRETQAHRIRRASARLEHQVVRRADAILFATRTNRDEYAAHYGSELACKFHVVSNGCDPDEFANPGGQTDPNCFVMVHAGSLYGARSPVPVFRAIAAVLAAGTIARSAFRLRLIGTAGDERFVNAAAELGLSDVVEFVPRMTRQEIITAMASASCLLVLQPGTTVSIPGKLYEYLAIGRPILSLSEEGELSDLVRQSGIGVAVNPHDTSSIEAGLRQVMELARRAELPCVDRELYDGNRPAQHAVRIMRAIADAPRAANARAKSRQTESADDSANSAFIKRA